MFSKPLVTCSSYFSLPYREGKLREKQNNWEGKLIQQMKEVIAIRREGGREGGRGSGEGVMEGGRGSSWRRSDEGRRGMRESGEGVMEGGEGARRGMRERGEGVRGRERRRKGGEGVERE